MSNAEIIPKIIANKKMTAKEISKESGINIKSLYVILNELVSRGLIMKVNDGKPSKYRGSTKKILLKNIYEIMMNKMKAIEKLTKDEIITIKMIDEVLSK